MRTIQREVGNKERSGVERVDKWSKTSSIVNQKKRCVVIIDVKFGSVYQSEVVADRVTIQWVSRQWGPRSDAEAEECKCGEGWVG